MHEPANLASVLRTLRLKVRTESCGWLNAAAIEVNTVWNWANETSAKAARPYSGKPQFLTGFDLNNLSAGATGYFAHIGAAVGIDLGLKDTATTSDGERLDAGRFYRGIEAAIAQAQRRGHKRQAKRLHRRAANRRKDALHKFSRRMVDRFQNIIVGDVSGNKLTQTRMAKSVLDAGWGMLRAQLQYKGEHACRSVVIVSEKHTSRACSSCACLSGPSGLSQLVVRQWECSACGAEHDRDVNAASNILKAGLRCRASVRGNESLYMLVPPSGAFRVSEPGTEAARAAA